jgi:hypothetical protein
MEIMTHWVWSSTREAVFLTIIKVIPMMVVTTFRVTSSRIENVILQSIHTFWFLQSTLG